MNTHQKQKKKTTYKYCYISHSNRFLSKIEMEFKEINFLNAIQSNQEFYRITKTS